MNINISPDLLKRIKMCAKKQGLTITDYVTDAMTIVLDGNEDLNLEERMKRLEKKLDKYIIENP